MPSLCLQTAELESVAVPLAKTLLLLAQQFLQALISSNLALDAHSRLGYLQSAKRRDMTALKTLYTIQGRNG